jgi:hypothetical protein
MAQRLVVVVLMLEKVIDVVSLYITYAAARQYFKLGGE